MASAIRAKLSFTSGRDFRDGEDETKRYQDLECALDDCLIKSPVNKVIVSKHWNKKADDPIDYEVEIVDTTQPAEITGNEVTLLDDDEKEEEEEKMLPSTRSKRGLNGIFKK